MFCMKCGAKIDNDVAFCPMCGSSTKDDEHTNSDQSIVNSDDNSKKHTISSETGINMPENSSFSVFINKVIDFIKKYWKIIVPVCAAGILLFVVASVLIVVIIMVSVKSPQAKAMDKYFQAVNDLDEDALWRASFPEKAEIDNPYEEVYTQELIDIMNESSGDSMSEMSNFLTDSSNQDVLIMIDEDSLQLKYNIVSMDKLEDCYITDGTQFLADKDILSLIERDEIRVNSDDVYVVQFHISVSDFWEDYIDMSQKNMVDITSEMKEEWEKNKDDYKEAYSYMGIDEDKFDELTLEELREYVMDYTIKQIKQGVDVAEHHIYTAFVYQYDDEWYVYFESDEFKDVCMFPANYTGEWLYMYLFSEYDYLFEDEYDDIPSNTEEFEEMHENYCYYKVYKNLKDEDLTDKELMEGVRSPLLYDLLSANH